MTIRNREVKGNILYKSIEYEGGEGRGWWEDENGNFFVRSYYTDDNPDAIGDVIMRDATEKAVGSWRQWGNIRMQHDPSRPIGKVKEIGEDDDLEWNRFIAHIVDEEAKKLIKAGVLSATSVGIIVLDYEEIDPEEVDYELSPLARASWFPPIRITEYEMVEISMVDNPMNRAAVVGGKVRKFAMSGMDEDQIQEIVESRAKALVMVKGATTYQNLPFAPDETTWDAGAARKNLRNWASSDGSGDKDTIDWAKYRKGFFWYDASDAENFGSYKLPFANIFSGTIKAVWRGITAAAQRLSATDMPSGDVSGVKSHIKKYYTKHGDTVPWEQEDGKSVDEGADGASSYRTEKEESPEVEQVPTVAQVSEENVMEEKEKETTEETVSEPEVEVGKDIEEVEDTEVEDTDVEEPEEVGDVPDGEDEYSELDVAVDRILGFMEEFKNEMLESVESLKGMLMNKAEGAAEVDDTEEETETAPTEIDMEKYIELVRRIVGEELDKVRDRKSAVVVDSESETDDDEPEKESLVRYIGANRDDIQRELRQVVSKHMKRD